MPTAQSEKSPVVVVTDPAVPFGHRLAGALAAAGSTVGLLCDGRRAPLEVTQAECELGSASGVALAAESLRHDLGGARWRAVIWAHVPPEAARFEALAGLEEAGWAAVAEAPLTGFLHLLKAARRHLGAEGRLVVVVPSEALTGSAGAVGWTAAAEGQRALLRVAARCWGPEGFRGHCLAAAASLLVEGLPGPGPPASRLPPASGAVPSVEGVAEVVGAVLSPGFKAVTGDTLGVDGGSWLAP